MDALADLKSVWWLIGPLLALVVWLVRLEALSKQNSEVTRDNKKQLAAIFAKVDQLAADRDVLKSKVSIHSDLLRPDKLEERYKDEAGFRARTEEQIKRLTEAARKAGVI